MQVFFRDLLGVRLLIRFAHYLEEIEGPNQPSVALYPCDNGAGSVAFVRWSKGGVEAPRRTMDVCREWKEEVVVVMRLHCQPLEMKILGAAAMATASDEMPCLEVAADAHSSAFARASARTSEALQCPLRLAVYGEGLVAAAQAASALATGLASAIVAAGQAAEVSVCLFHGLTAAELLADADSQTLRDLRGRRGPGLRQLLSQERPEVLFLVAGSCDLGLRDASPNEAMGSLLGLVRKAQELGYFWQPVN
ncbi:hypothetical protein AK812_SmicGene18391 [Symbiodinium microadriaticum]|uniref:Uncharacterized protein n=1 Tax=Symbiodinium microadriaticum TaxID=2951 RepID=A0A1Q9DVB5_SYMMI|nr:hypothetical protein AK812_SmicGene18391 [Symbiodinium microadriaticum]